MYIKIQKEDSDDYLIFEGKEIETTKLRFPVTSSEYLDFLKDELNMIEISKEHTGLFVLSELSRNIRKTLKLNNEKIVTNYSINEVKERLAHPEKYVSRSGSVTSIIVDSKQYVTFGHIYVLNDKGQTIQSL